MKSFPSLMVPQGGADLRVIIPQSDTSRSCEITDTGPMHCIVLVRPFAAQLSPVLNKRLRSDGTLLKST